MHLLCGSCSVVQEVTSPSDATCSSCGSALPLRDARSTLPGDRWSVLMNGRQQGPFSAEEFALGLEKKQFSWTMLVWRQGLRSWRPARRDELLVMAVAGKLGLAGKTVRLDGLQVLMQAATVPEAPSEWLVEEQPGSDDTRRDSPRPQSAEPRTIPPPLRSQGSEPRTSPPPLRPQGSEPRTIPPPLRSQGSEPRTIPPPLRPQSVEPLTIPPPLRSQGSEPRTVPPPLRPRSAEARTVPPPLPPRTREAQDADSYIPVQSVGLLASTSISRHAIDPWTTVATSSGSSPVSDSDVATTSSLPVFDAELATTSSLPVLDAELATTSSLPVFDAELATTSSLPVFDSELATTSSSPVFAPHVTTTSAEPELDVVPTSPTLASDVATSSGSSTESQRDVAFPGPTRAFASDVATSSGSSSESQRDVAFPGPTRAFASDVATPSGSSSESQRDVAFPGPTRAFAPDVAPSSSSSSAFEVDVASTDSSPVFTVDVASTSSSSLAIEPNFTSPSSASASLADVARTSSSSLAFEPEVAAPSGSSPAWASDVGTSPAFASDVGTSSGSSPAFALDVAVTASASRPFELLRPKGPSTDLPARSRESRAPRERGAAHEMPPPAPPHEVDDTRVESWPLAMQLYGSQTSAEPPTSSNLRRRTSTLPPPPRLPPDARIGTRIDTREVLLTTSPEANEPTAGFQRSSRYAPRGGGGGAWWIASLAFAAGALLAVVSVRMNGGLPTQALSTLGLGTSESAAPQAGLAARSAGKQAQVAPAETTPHATAPAAPKPQQLARAADTGSPLVPGAPSVSGTVPSSLEVVTRDLPAPEEVRDELKRLSSSLRRCTRTPALGLAIDLTIDGATGRVRTMNVTAPALGPGSLECLKETLTELRVAPFVRSELEFRHRYIW